MLSLLVQCLLEHVSDISKSITKSDVATPVIWRGPRKTNLIKRFLKDTYWGKLDYLIIDTPPGTSDEHISTISSIKKANPDGAVIVTTPQEVSLSTIRKEVFSFPFPSLISDLILS